MGDRWKPHVPMLYLDLDGTVRQGLDDDLGRFVNGPDDVRVFPEAVEMMRRWKDTGGRIVGVSNQGGIALGHVTEENVAAAMRETTRQAEGLFDLVLWCKHHPQAATARWARCSCRKPKAGMLVAAATELSAWFREEYPADLGMMVGDRPEDRGAAEAAGVNFCPAAAWRAMAADSPAFPEAVMVPDEVSRIDGCTCKPGGSAPIHITTCAVLDLPAAEFDRRHADAAARVRAWVDGKHTRTQALARGLANGADPLYMPHSGPGAQP